MDEPTVALSDTEVVVVKKAIARLKAQGTSVLFVSHRLNEVLEVSDRVTVLKDGNYVGTHDVGTLDREKLVSLIIGEEGGLADAPDLPVVMPDTAVLLEVRDLMGGPLKGINFELRAGEILGIAGLVGSGRTSVLQNIFGAQRPSSGTVIVSGKEVSFRSPYDSVKLGLAMIPEERRAEGLLLRRSIRENVVLAHLKKFRWNKKLPVPSHRLEDQAALKGKEDLSIRMAGTRQLVSQLSGGNQQKVLVARWLADSGLKILILDEPTKGVDVGAKAEIFDIVRELAKQGVGVIMVSSDLEEVAAVCHRAVVLVEGNQVGEVTRPFSDGDILSMCFAGVA
jgi:ABC-type branched-subunit amino acid transport system ATPase component